MGGGGGGGRRIVVNSFYTALFSTLEQTHCARIVSGLNGQGKRANEGSIYGLCYSGGFIGWEADVMP